MAWRPVGVQPLSQPVITFTDAYVYLSYLAFIMSPVFHDGDNTAGNKFKSVSTLREYIRVQFFCSIIDIKHWFKQRLSAELVTSTYLN